jgi:hypothetical protein
VQGGLSGKHLSGARFTGISRRLCSDHGPKGLSGRVREHEMSLLVRVGRSEKGKTRLAGQFPLSLRKVAAVMKANSEELGGRF